MELVQTKIPNTIKLNLPENDTTIICDKNKLSTVFHNVILNSIQAMDNRGIIEIRLKENVGNVIMEIEDSGTGIPNDIRDKLFDPLFTTKQQGTGLGLASVKSIIESHGGNISVTFSPTIFTITLPKKSN